MGNPIYIQKVFAGQTNPCRPEGFIPPGSPGHYNFLKSPIKELAAAEAAIRLKYPYPPKDCNQAMQSVMNMETEIAGLNELVASGRATFDNKRKLEAYQNVLQNFRVYVNNAMCITNAIKAEDEAWNQQIAQKLAEEQAAASGVKTMDNVVIFSVIGILIVGALIIIVKK